jgi:hypothetical protein
MSPAVPCKFQNMKVAILSLSLGVPLIRWDSLQNFAHIGKQKVSNFKTGECKASRFLRENFFFCPNLKKTFW